MADVTPRKPSKGLLTKKLGPLPVWGWMIVGVGIAVVLASVNGQRAKDKATTDKENGGDGGGYGGTYGMNDYGGYGVNLIGGSQRPPVVFQNSTNIVTPPMGGRPFPPSAPGTPQPCPPAAGRWITIPGRKGAPCGPTGNPLLKIAQELFSNGDLWRSIWEASENQALRARRKTPMRLQGGDQVWVPNLNSGGTVCPPGTPPAACPPGQPGPPPPPPPHYPTIPAPPPPPGPGGHHVMPGRAGGRRHRR